MEFGSFGGRPGDKYNRVCFVEISKILVKQMHFSLERNHLTTVIMVLQRRNKAHFTGYWMANTML